MFTRNLFISILFYSKIVKNNKQVLHRLLQLFYFKEIFIISDRSIGIDSFGNNENYLLRYFIHMCECAHTICSFNKHTLCANKTGFETNRNGSKNITRSWFERKKSDSIIVPTSRHNSKDFSWRVFTSNRLLGLLLIYYYFRIIITFRIIIIITYVKLNNKRMEYFRWIEFKISSYHFPKKPDAYFNLNDDYLYN